MQRETKKQRKWRIREMNEQRSRGNGETEKRRKEASKQEKTSLPCSEFSLMLSIEMQIGRFVSH